VHPLLEKLLSHTPVVTDGAWGTELTKRGLPPGEPPERWNLDRPEEVAAVAQGYVQAGSQVILTNTFGANRFRLADYGLAEELVTINRLGAKISLEAAGGKAYVFASLGPTGKMIFAGEISPVEVIEAYREQARVLAEAGVHGFVIETMSDVQEAQLALSGVKPLGLPVVVCMTFDTGPESDRTMMGVTPEEAAQILTESDADAVGANCGTGIERFFNVLERLKKGTNKPLWLKPNAGLPRIENGVAVYDAIPEDFAEKAVQLAYQGAAFIGGCCGTTPEFIRAINQRLGR